jgi:hypothetical protein
LASFKWRGCKRLNSDDDDTINDAIRRYNSALSLSLSSQWDEWSIVCIFYFYVHLPPMNRQPMPKKTPNKAISERIYSYISL